MSSIIIAGSLAAILAAVLFLAFSEVRRRTRAEIDADNSRQALRDRQRLDEILARRIGRREKLLRFLRKREGNE
jgi:hypothetical protein